MISNVISPLHTVLLTLRAMMFFYFVAHLARSVQDIAVWSHRHQYWEIKWQHVVTDLKLFPQIIYFDGYFSVRICNCSNAYELCVRSICLRCTTKTSQPSFGQFLTNQLVIPILCNEFSLFIVLQVTYTTEDVILFTCINMFLIRWNKSVS